MIDTLKLQLSDYEIRSANSLIIQPQTYKLSEENTTHPQYLFEYNGQSIEGQKAYYNDPNINLTISPMKNSNISCFVQTSLPKILTGNNFHSVGEGGIKAGLKKVEQCLKDAGISTNIIDAKVSRFDAFKNVVLEEQFQDYHSILSLLRMPRKKMRIYGDGFLHHTTIEELCIYNKIEEMKNLNKDVSGLPQNVARFELRLLKHQSVKNSTGINNAGDLLKSYSDIQDYYRNKLNKTLFSYDVKDITIITVSDLEEKFRYFKNKIGRNWMQKFLQAEGLKSILEYSDMDTIKTAILNLTQDRMKAHRLIKSLEETEKDILLSEQSKSSYKSNMDLYQELKKKLVA